MKKKLEIALFLGAIAFAVVSVSVFFNSEATINLTVANKRLSSFDPVG